MHDNALRDFTTEIEMNNVLDEVNKCVISVLMDSHVLSFTLLCSHVLSCTLLYSHVLSCALMYSHVISCTLLCSHILSCTLMYSHVLSCAPMYSHVLSCALMYSHVLSRTNVIFFMFLCYFKLNFTFVKRYFPLCCNTCKY